MEGSITSISKPYKRETQKENFSEHRYRYPQEDTGKQNETNHQKADVSMISEFQGWFHIHKSTSTVHHINITSDKYHMIIKIDEKKTWKNLVSIHDKILEENMYRKPYFTW